MWGSGVFCERSRRAMLRTGQVLPTWKSEKCWLVALVVEESAKIWPWLMDCGSMLNACIAQTFRDAIVREKSTGKRATSSSRKPLGEHVVRWQTTKMGDFHGFPILFCWGSLVLLSCSSGLQWGNRSTCINQISPAAATAGPLEVQAWRKHNDTSTQSTSKHPWAVIKNPWGLWTYLDSWGLSDHYGKPCQPTYRTPPLLSMIKPGNTSNQTRLNLNQTMPKPSKQSAPSQD